MSFILKSFKAPTVAIASMHKYFEFECHQVWTYNFAKLFQSIAKDWLSCAALTPVGELTRNDSDLFEVNFSGETKKS